MKKSKLLVVCLIGVLMAVGLVLASCGPACKCTDFAGDYEKVKKECTESGGCDYAKGLSGKCVC